MQAGDRPGEASTRNQLGTLYNRMPGRREEAVQFFRQAAEIYADPTAPNPLTEGLARSNAANSLIALDRHDEARSELTRALECKRGLGANAEPWKTWNILYKLETAERNTAAAADARRQAMAAYLSARRQGWQITQGPAAQLCQQVGLIILSNHPATPPDQIPAELRQQLPQLETELRRQSEAACNDPDMPPRMQALARAVLAILDGSRDPSLAEDPALSYADAVELQLLLEQLP